MAVKLKKKREKRVKKKYAPANNIELVALSFSLLTVQSQKVVKAQVHSDPINWPFVTDCQPFLFNLFSFLIQTSVSFIFFIILRSGWEEKKIKERRSKTWVTTGRLPFHFL